MKWDEWRGSLDGNVVMWIKYLCAIGSFRVVLHKFVDCDGEGCFHTHPRHALRVVLKGGYVEEMEDGRRYTRRVGYVGFVRPATSHRIAGLLNGPSYSLWIRFPTKKHEIMLRGDGWT